VHGNIIILRSVNTSRSFSQSVPAKPFIVHQYTRHFLLCCLQFIIFFTYFTIRRNAIWDIGRLFCKPQLTIDRVDSYAVGGYVIRSTGGSLQQVDP